MLSTIIMVMRIRTVIRWCRLGCMLIMIMIMVIHMIIVIRTITGIHMVTGIHMIMIMGIRIIMFPRATLPWAA